MTVLITGANRGIGLALATAYAKTGHEVIGTSRSHSPGQDAAITWHTLHVQTPESQADLAKALGGSPISLLVCNAGVFLDRGEALGDGFPTEQWADTFATNVTGVFLTVQSLLPNLRLAPSAKIAIIASKMGSTARAPGGSYIYRASKAAVVNLGRNLAADLSADGIAVGIYHPGWVRTDLGGPAATVSVEQSADGLAQRIDHLSLATTGCFEAFDGDALPY